MTHGIKPILILMMFDLEMIRSLYLDWPDRISRNRDLVKRPLTLTEKILYAHLDREQIRTDFRRGADYVSFNPDRVAMQDATAQMALLQFMHAGKDKDRKSVV